MPDSTGFGDYTESGQAGTALLRTRLSRICLSVRELDRLQVIPVVYKGEQGGYTHAMFLDDEPPIAGGREIWGFPKKLASPTLRVHADTLIGTLDYGPVRVATGTMGYKHAAANTEAVMRAMREPGTRDPRPCGQDFVCLFDCGAYRRVTTSFSRTRRVSVENHPSRRRHPARVRARAVLFGRDHTARGVDGASGA